jgi:hypothetical protein
MPLNGFPFAAFLFLPFVMKKFLPIVFFIGLVACSSKNQEEAVKEWPEMDSFHLIMAEAYHPFKDSANLEPAKLLAQDLADEATKWSSAALPESVNNDDMKAQVSNLVAGTSDFLSLVSESASDSLVGISLSNMHDTFHRIQEGWYSGGEEDHH